MLIKKYERCRASVLLDLYGYAADDEVYISLAPGFGML